MSIHSIDSAMLEPEDNGSPGRRDFLIEDPYWNSKDDLLSDIARANQCRCVWSRYKRTVVVFGFENDIENVELLFTSLLVQATTTMMSYGSVQNVFGESETRSFRKSFLDGFAVRISKRSRNWEQCEDRLDRITRDTQPVGPQLTKLD